MPKGYRLAVGNSNSWKLESHWKFSKLQYFHDKREGSLAQQLSAISIPEEPRFYFYFFFNLKEL
jgi:hypothetical protein